MDWFHWIFSGVLSAVGVVVIVGFVMTGVSEPQWLWPRVRREETTGAIRAGRVAHWTFVGIACVALCGGIGLGMLLSTPEESWTAAGIGLGIAAIFALLGRGIRYILGNE